MKKLKFRFKFRQGKKYRTHTIEINYEDIKSDFWKNGYDIKKVSKICKEWINSNGGGELQWIFD